MIKSLDEFDLGENARNPADFYAQSRSMADYFQQRSGNPAIFHSIASHISAGHTIENWLSKYGETYNLPTDQMALEADWKEWMKSFYTS